MKKINMNINLGGLKLTTPIVCASGTFGFGEELKGMTNFNHIGAITTKTITLKPRAGNPPPRIYETECGVLNSVGLENPGLDGFIKEKLPLIRGLKTKCIVSVGGFSTTEYKTIVKSLNQRQGIDAIELNLSCPNLQLKKLVSQSPKATYQLIKSLRKLTKKPLFAKITPEVTDIVKVARAAKDAGVDAIALVNTFFSMAIDIDTQKPVLGNIYGGYSGKAIKPMSLYRVWKVSQDVKIPIIGGGGIDTWRDAVEFILAGAKAVSIGTVNLTYPNKAKDISQGIKGYLSKKKIKDIKGMQGALNG
jgi:dihydroorotate dehydrogenase (NAD+) catalytic subunit